MPSKKLFFAFLLAILCLSFASAGWWNSSWNNRINITIEEKDGATLTNYTILRNITYETNMQSDFDDLRFINASNNQELGYWIENKSDGKWANVWIMVPKLPASANTTVGMYYNNPTATSNSAGTNAFWLFVNDTNQKTGAICNTFSDAKSQNLTFYGNWTYEYARIKVNGAFSGANAHYVQSVIDTDYHDLAYGTLDCGGDGYEAEPPDTACRFDNAGDYTVRGERMTPQNTTGNFKWYVEWKNSGDCATARTIEAIVFAIRGWAITEPVLYTTSAESGDTTAPNLTITSPSSTVSSAGITINFTSNDTSGVDTCFYNITRGASTEKTNTVLTSTNTFYNDTFTLSGVATYVLSVFCNDTFGNSNQTNKTFIYALSGVGGGGGAVSPFTTAQIEDMYIKGEVCVPFKEAFQVSYEESKYAGNVFNRISFLWSTFWDYALCSGSAGTIVPL